MVTKAKYLKGCHILAEMAHWIKDWKRGKNVAITGNSIVLAYPWGIRKFASGRSLPVQNL